MQTVIHVTHEAVQKIGGIGAVLDGLITSRAYQREIGRTIIVGPRLSGLDEMELARNGEVYYASVSGTGNGKVAALLRGIEQKYNVNFVYGRRRLEGLSEGMRADPEVLLVGTGDMNGDLENRFKFRLYQRFGLQSDRYERIDDYLLYLRIAEPAYEAVSALVGKEAGPHFVLAHEYMGMPTALKAVLEGDPRFRAIFYAHEVATIRPIVENSPGHDTMFYNVMDSAMEQGLSVSDVFGDQSGYYRHALIERARFCDNIFAVGDRVVQELRFLEPEFLQAPIDLVYNGIPAFEISLEEKWASIERLRGYTEALCGSRPEAIFAHVTRLVMSKGLWRDIQVLEHLDRAFAAEGRRGVMFILSTAGGTRSPEDVRRMEAEYGWPVVHREGYPDLVGGEVGFWAFLEGYNRRAKAIRVVYVNQFGWDPERCGRRMPEDMTLMDLRKGTHVEFGQSIYEPFGIAQVEPLSFGALCVISSVCGCRGYVARAAGGEPFPNLIVADYTALPKPRSLEEMLQIDRFERDWIESYVTQTTAEEIAKRLPRTGKEMEAGIRRGYEVAERMSWEHVCQELFLPGLKRACGRGERRTV